MEMFITSTWGHLCPAFRQEAGGQTVLLVSAASQWPSVQIIIFQSAGFGVVESRTQSIYNGGQLHGGVSCAVTQSPVLRGSWTRDNLNGEPRFSPQGHVS